MNIDSMLINFQSQIHQDFRKSLKLNHILHGGTIMPYLQQNDLPFLTVNTEIIITPVFVLL